MHIYSSGIRSLHVIEPDLHYFSSIDFGEHLYRFRNFFDSSRVSSKNFLVASSKKANSLSE
jgi:hypothetical protein